MSRQLCTKATNGCSLSERCGRYKDPKNIKLLISGVKKKKQARLSVCVHMRSKNDVKILDRLFFPKVGGASQNCLFFVHHLTYLMGGEFGNETCIDIFSVYTIADG